MKKETYLTEGCLNDIKKVAVLASVNAPEVSYATNTDTFGIGFPLFGLLGLGAELAVRSGIDHDHAGKIREHVDLSDIEDRMARSFVEAVREGNRFQVIENPKDRNHNESLLSSAEYDAVISLDVRKISLDREPGDYVKLTVQVRGQLKNLVSGKTVWDREDIIISPKRHPIKYYEENGLRELDAILGEAGKKLAYDFIYLK